MTDQASHDFARPRRIVKADEFSSAFRLRPVQRSKHFVLYARPNQLANARLGVVVAKRFAPRAVTRNMIKRVTREVFRMSQLPAIDCVVRLSGPVNTKAGPATSSVLKQTLRVELLRLFATQAQPGALARAQAMADAAPAQLPRKAAAPARSSAPGVAT